MVQGRNGSSTSLHVGAARVIQVTTVREHLERQWEPLMFWVCKIIREALEYIRSSTSDGPS